ncbi:MAG: hypothetical protein A3A24_00170 [Candidatus Buchananbacteria bacterium RIFCSPLOWO2_01_FULL_46_12]|uniref:Large ribosomal subunit protein bL25 n=1 Tax=Candidatus Buchananbacteria bacterium RIFCSPLOWO2_01_FULL_46_12 TaxID=1797546 RepID=A0A1G1YN72_9BACT|nr:MAG: hypothetical protein A3A24_00170 [Candidatus Buchananbacteria bacterium RIFCSPLOWO2_01_FULL_46_12]
MSNLSLVAKIREVKGKKVSSLRKQGQIPAILYGHGSKTVSLVIDEVPFAKIYQQAGESTLVDLKLDNKEPIKVLIHDIQYDALTDRLIHVDFLQVKMDEKIHARVTLKFVGEAPAVKELTGILVTNLNEVEIECLPNDLVHEISVELSPLKTFDDYIKISDLKVPTGIKILNQADETVAVVQEPREEKEYTTTVTEETAPASVTPAAAGTAEDSPEAKTKEEKK